MACPQLHRHAVIFNLTETAAGKIKPVQPLEFYKTQTYATAIYRIELANRLQKLGYEIQIDPKTRAPEIKGFDSAYLKESSLRSQEIQKEAALVKDQFELNGSTIKNDAGIKQVAAWQGRESKAFDPEEMKSRVLQLEVKYDFQAQRIVGQALQNSGFQYDAAAQAQNAQKAVNFAKELASPSAGQDAKLTERQFLTEALKNGFGSTNFDAVRQEYSERSAIGEFSNLIKNDADRSLSREAKQETGKAIAERKAVEPAAKEIDSLSMDALENSVRQKIIVENEVSQSIEILIGL